MVTFRKLFIALFGFKNNMARCFVWVLFFLVLAGAGHAAANFSNKVSYYYTFNDTNISSSQAYDVTGNGNHSNYSNTQTLTGIAGITGQAFKLIKNSANITQNFSNITVPLITLNTAKPNDTTLAFWMVPNASAAKMIFGFEGSTDHYIYYSNFNTIQLHGSAPATGVNFDISGHPLTNNSYHLIMITFDWYAANSSIMTRLYVDCNESASASNNIGAAIYLNQFGHRTTETTYTFDGRVDNLGLWTEFLGNGTPGWCSEMLAAGHNGTELFPAGASAPTSFFEVSAQDDFNSSALTNFTANVSNASDAFFFSTTNGTIVTNITAGSGVFNVSVGSNESGGYYVEVNLNHDSSANLISAMSKLFRYFDANFSGNVSYGGINYVRTLHYQVNYTCPDWASANITTYINGSVYSSSAAVCNNVTAISNFSYLHGSELQFDLSVYFNASYLPSVNSDQSANSSFFADLVNPEVDVLNISAPEGFINASGNVSLNCVDSVFPNLTYNMTFNSADIFYDNLLNNTLQVNSTDFQDGTNTLVGVCADPFNSTSASTSLDVYVKVLALIDERDNVAFDVANISRARVYYDDNSSYYQFGGSNGSSTNFTSSTNAKLRFELLYSSGTIVTRYVDVSLNDGSDLRVCANKEGVTHYEQLIISASQRPAVLKNVFSDCLVAADYTRFAYQDAFVLKAFTIASLYYLYTYESGQQAILASLDGSISAYVNLDTIEFASEQTSVNILADSLSFQDVGNSTVQIYYLNIRNDSTALTVVIERMDTATTVLNTSSFSDPNEFIILFDYSTLAPAVNSSTLFKITLYKTADYGSSSFSRYFNPKGKSGIMNAKLAFVLSFLLTFFGLTFTISRSTFSWFGLFVLLIAMVILGFAVATWYTTVLMVLEAILLIYIGVLMWNQNYPTVT